MTTQEAIERLKQMEIDANSNTIWHISMDGRHKEIDIAIKALEEQDKHRWIPVSERLPSKEGYYITTTMYNEVYCDYWGGDNFNRTETVIAWAEMPEPYKKE